jgi:hypothetical protein
MSKLHFSELRKIVVVSSRPSVSEEWRDVRPESVETFRRIHASKEFTAKAAHAAFAGAGARAKLVK